MADTLPPTPAELRARSELLRLKFPAPAGSDPDPMDESRVLTDAISQVESWTARIIDPNTPCHSAYADTCEAVPAGMEPLAIRAVTLMAEAITVNSESKLARKRAGRLRLRGFTAGPYSEQYWDPGMVRGGAGKRPQFVDDPDLDDILWALATEEARDMLIAETTGVQAPAGVASAFDYNNKVGIGRIGNIGPLGPTGGPDGF